MVRTLGGGLNSSSSIIMSHHPLSRFNVACAVTCALGACYSTHPAARSRGPRLASSFPNTPRTGSRPGTRRVRRPGRWSAPAQVCVVCGCGGSCVPLRLQPDQETQAQHGGGRLRVGIVPARVVREPVLAAVGVAAEPVGLPVIRDEPEALIVVADLTEHHAFPLAAVSAKNTASVASF